MPARVCSICQRTDLPAIDAALMAGGKLIPTAAQFNTTKSVLHRHKINCLAPKLAAAAKMVAPAKETKAPVIRAREIAAGAMPTPQEVLSLTALLDRLARSLDRLEGSAQVAHSDGLHASLAALSGQLHRGVETAAKLQNFYSEPQTHQAEKFSISICLPQLDTKQPITLDCARAEPEDAAPRLPPRGSFAVGFDLNTSRRDDSEDEGRE